MNKKQKDKLTDNIVFTIIVVFFFLPVPVMVTLDIIDKAITKHEKQECIKWQDQKETYRFFYATGWQVEQCQQFKINLN